MSVDDKVTQLENQVMGNTTQSQDNPSGNTPVTSQEAPQAPPDPEEWYDSLDEPTRGVVDAYNVKLQNALKEERQQRKELQKQLKELAARPVDDTQWKSKIEEISGQLTEANLKASFYESAAEQANLPAKRYAVAYKIAKIDGLISDDGEVDWKALQEQHDYLFSAPTQETQQRKPGNAGSGIGGKPQPKRGMNDLIRGT
jgi:hypothetical protein